MRNECGHEGSAGRKFDETSPVDHGCLPLVRRWFREVTHRDLTNLASDFAAVGVGAAEVDAAPYARIVDFRGYFRKSRVAADDAEWTGKGHAYIHFVAAEEAAQDGLGSAGKNSMRGGIIRMRRRPQERFPGRIAVGCRANGRDRPPMRTLVFFLEADDLRIGRRHRENTKQLGVLRYRQVPGCRCGACGGMPWHCG